MTWGMVAGGALVAGATVYSASKGSAAAKDAASTQANATMAGVNELRRQFDVTQENLQPFMAAGGQAIYNQRKMLGLLGREKQQLAFDKFVSSPGQKWLRQKQEKALLRNASKIGGLGGGNVRTALQEQAFQRAQTDFERQFGRLGALSGAGQSAVQNLAQVGGQTSTGIAQLQQAGGAARASGILGAQQAQSAGLEGLAGIAGGFLQGGGLSGFNQPQPSTYGAGGGQPGLWGQGF